MIQIQNCLQLIQHVKLITRTCFCNCRLILLCAVFYGLHITAGFGDIIHQSLMQVHFCDKRIKRVL